MIKYISFIFCLAIPYCGIGQTTYLDSIQHDQLQRKYILHIPTNYNSASPHDLVFVLHGGTGSANGMMNFTGFNDLSDLENFIVVYPQGIFTGNSIFGSVGHHWADGRTTTIPDTLGVDDVGFISNLIDTISGQFNIDQGNIFATGISNGGYMAQRLACQLSNKISAVATVAATFPDSLVQFCINPQPVSVLIINGTNDNFVPTNTGGMATGTGGYVSSTIDMVNIWLDNNGCTQAIDSSQIPNISTTDQSTVTKYTYNDCVDSTSIVYFKIWGGGHTWPGEVFHVPLTGITNEDINANNEIWNFFKTTAVTTSNSETIEASDIKIYPNPFTDVVTIESAEGLRVKKIEVFDMHLKKVDFKIHNDQLANGILSIRGSFNTGIYIMNISTNSGSFTRKIIAKGH